MLLLALLLAARASSDPYGPAPRDEAARLERAAQFGEPGADARIGSWLAAHPIAPKADRRRLAHRLCGDLEVKSAYVTAARACGDATALGADDGQDQANMALLRATPPIRAIGAARVALVANPTGSRNAIVTAAGVSTLWIVDSGAEISVLSDSLARRIGVHPFAAKIGVGSSTGDVEGGLGVLPELRIGDARVTNVPVLILPDAQLSIAGLPPIQAILGLPVMVAFRRVAWSDHGRELALGDAAPPAPVDAPRLYWHEDGVGVPITTARGTMGSHLDSGANASSLRPPGRALLDPVTAVSARVRSGKMGGAAGVVDTHDFVYPHLRLSVAGVPLQLTDIALEPGEKEGAGQLGDDVIRQLSRLVLDFGRMRVAAQ